MLNNKYDVIVVGGGHAGIEASLACSRMGSKTLLITINIDTIGKMSCNPAIGGIAKGHIVRELDALGAEMAKATDKTGIQYRMLNLSKGPAVHAPRAQVDKKAYQTYMQHVVEKQENLYILQDNATELLIENQTIIGIKTARNNEYYASKIILTTGTFMQGLIHIGEYQEAAGRMGDPPSTISLSLKKAGLEVGRLKTGTPSRIDGNTIDFSELEEQKGDDKLFAFSHFTEEYPQSIISCYIAYTNEVTHTIINEHLNESPMFSGKIKSVGPRYCPSIEDKIYRFSDKGRHQLFLEPEGINTNEYYINGLSSSLPENVQYKVIHSINGLGNAHINRIGYAIEYDFCPPNQLKMTLESKLIHGLYLAGQINGTSGYEEAAAQGFWAGVNSVLALRKENPFIITRAESYIGVLIDDLVTKGIEDPYRMFTSRAEYRLSLRYDNADKRLIHYGRQLGLISSENYEYIKNKLNIVDEIIHYCNNHHFNLEDFNNISDDIKNYTKLGETPATVIRRKQLNIETIRELCLPFKNMSLENWVIAEINIIYEGYLKRQQEEIDRFMKYEKEIIPENFDYNKVEGLLTEAKVKLNKIRPISVGQAARISGVNPTDISLLILYLRGKKEVKYY